MPETNQYQTTLNIAFETMNLDCPRFALKMFNMVSDTSSRNLRQMAGKSLLSIQISRGQVGLAFLGFFLSLFGPAVQSKMRGHSIHSLSCLSVWLCSRLLGRL